MRVMATEASNPACVHKARNKVIALHPILVGSPIGEMREGRLAEFMLFQFPKFIQTLAHVEADGPVVGFSL